MKSVACDDKVSAEPATSGSSWRRHGLVLLSVFLATPAIAQVVGSKHDMSTLSGSGTDEVCVFCHTPHGANDTAAAPLWNKILPDPASFEQYSTLGTASFDSAQAPVGSVSLACLSCHDGTQARDVVLNAPGSGRYNPAGAPIGSIGVMTGTPVPVLGTDLTNDHPISIQYGGGGAVASDGDGEFGGTLGDPDFELPFKATINNKPIWWVDSPAGTDGTREKTDMLLYSRDDIGSVVQPFVECGSCHDPHNSDSFIDGQQVAFLRIDNSDSQVCTTCHIK